MRVCKPAAELHVHVRYSCPQSETPRCAKTLPASLFPLPAAPKHIGWELLLVARLPSWSQRYDGLPRAETRPCATPCTPLL